MATFIDINYPTSKTRPVRAESNIGTNPGYVAGKQTSGVGRVGEAGYRTPLPQRLRKVLNLLGKDSCGCRR